MKPVKRHLRKIQKQSFTAMDSIISDLDTRFQRIADIVNEFYAVLKVRQISEDKISSVCQPLITKYSSDLKIK